MRIANIEALIETTLRDAGVTFVGDAMAYSRFIDMADWVISQVRFGTVRRHLVDDAEMAMFIRKLAKYCGNGEKLYDVIDTTDTLADAITEFPKLIDSVHGLPFIIDQHRAASARRARKLQSVTSDTPVTVIARSGDYYLGEAHTPQHLQQASGALGHCAGTSYNEEALKAYKLKEGQPGSEYCLVYFMKMRSGEKRVFNLYGKDDKPVATMDYNPHTQCITQIEGRNRNVGNDGASRPDHRIKAEDPFFMALCDCLHQMPECGIPVNMIGGLPTTRTRLLTSKGMYVEAAHLRNEHVLVGEVLVDARLSDELLARFAGMKRVTLNVPDAYTARLPASIAGSLSLEQSELPPGPQPTGLTAFNNMSFIDNVEEVGGTLSMMNINFGSQLTARNLRRSGRVVAMLSMLQLPALEEAGEISAPGAEIVDLYSLKKATSVDLRGCQTLYINKEFTRQYGAKLFVPPTCNVRYCPAPAGTFAMPKTEDAPAPHKGHPSPPTRRGGPGQ